MEARPDALRDALCDIEIELINLMHAMRTTQRALRTQVERAVALHEHLMAAVDAWHPGVVADPSDT